MYKNIFTPAHYDIPGDMEEEIDEEEEVNISNELRRQYEEENNRKREHSLSSYSSSTQASPTFKPKKRQNNYLSGSEDDADTESDSGQTLQKSDNKVLHSTLREDLLQKTIQGKSPKCQSIPETPNTITQFTRYHSEPAINSSKSTHLEAYQAQTQKQNMKTALGPQHV